jgi:hypothetical protein
MHNIENNAMKTEYKIKKHGQKWSIDQYVNGQFISQIAYWFKSSGAARRRLNEIIAEDQI